MAIFNSYVRHYQRVDTTMAPNGPSGRSSNLPRLQSSQVLELVAAVVLLAVPAWKWSVFSWVEF